MSGMSTLAITEYPDQFQEETFTPSVAADTVLNFFPGRTVVIDKVWVLYHTAGGSGCTVQLLRGITGTDANVAAVVTAARDITAAVDATATANVAYTPTVQTDNNVLSSTDYIVIDYAGTISPLAQLTIRIRYRTRVT